MKRRKFIAATAAGTLATATNALATNANSMDNTQEIYELRRYTFRFRGNKELLHKFIRDGIIPAYNRQGISNIGVFTELGNSEPAKLYLLIPYASFEQMENLPIALLSDKAYQAAANAYDKIPVEQTVFSRYDTWLMKALLNIPKMQIPEKTEGRIFELRTYEGYSEDAVRRKVKMFNDEELALFYKLKLNPVFFGNILSGPQLPAMAYMLSFNNMEERDEAWTKFFDHPEWKRMLAAPEYANTVSHIIRVFLKPTDYSQV